MNPKPSSERKPTGFEIAVIGMAGRFPGAKDIHEFWENLKKGVESISFLTEKDIEKHQISPELLENPDFVRSKGGVLEGKEYFDASFFNYSPREAETMDPQLRLFHECSWHALEDAGYNPDSYNGEIGVYAGASANFKWKLLTALTGKTDTLGHFASFLLTDKDFLVTRVAYSLNLKGSAVIIQSLCSTSLVAIHVACRALLTGECDMALAGGVRLTSDHETGYIYREGMIGSSDGHCRAFDAGASGTVAGDGVGVVVLKRLKRAAADRDNIQAVILGSAVNNDGKQKVGFTAPSVEAQANVIKKALHISRVEHESITYIEAHGTGTSLGDTIEIEALKQAFNTNKKGFCGIGAVKANIGHLDSAAGAAGFIKAVLALKHRVLPPAVNFDNPNPEIDFENSPFYVNKKSREWKNDQYPLRAGVSSFGIGGTNAHVVLEAWGMEHGARSEEGRDYQLILLSARTTSALEKMSESLVKYFKKNPVNPVKPGLADAAYTLQVGRKHFQHRRMVVCRDVEEVVEALSNPDSRKVQTAYSDIENPRVVFMFPGLGPQYVNMGRELYEKEPLFREEMDRCFEILEPLMGCDIKKILYPDTGLTDINRIEVIQPVVFIIEYALAKLLMRWGLQPDALIGYSFGEYTAACISGVFSLEDALNLIVYRGELIAETSPGAMLSVPLPVEKVKPLLPGELAIAIDNGPSCIAAGPREAVAAFANRMKAKKYLCMPLQSNHAIHSPLMAPILQPFAEKLRQIPLNKPRVPFISNATGTWISGDEAVDPGYWARHLSNTVLFAGGIKELLKEPGSIFIEVGPGHDLSVLCRHHVNTGGEAEPVIVNLVKHPREKIPDDYYLLNKLGRLWLAGTRIDWQAFYAEEERCRISLPPYPFERTAYWIEGDPYKMVPGMLKRRSTEKRADITDWFYVPSWKYAPLPVGPGDYKKISKESCWLLFMDESGLGLQLKKQLEHEEVDVITVRTGSAFTKEMNQSYSYTVNPRESADYNTLLKEFTRMGKVPDKIVHLWGMTDGKGKKEESVNEALNSGFYSLIYLAQAIGKQNYREQIQVAVVTGHMQKVTGEEMVSPGKMTVLGAVKVIPQEYFNISCCSIDAALPKTQNLAYELERTANQLLMEFIKEFPDTIIAYRDGWRWVEIVEPVSLEKQEHVPPRLKKGGVCLVTGGLGGLGYAVAEHLAKSVQAKLILTGRTALPPREEWDQWLNSHPDDDGVSRKIRKVLALEALNAEVLVCRADVSDYEQMQRVIVMADKRFGRIDGVIHAAGLPDGGVIPLRTREKTDEILAPKVKGTLVLDEVLKNTPLDFFVIFSSLASITGALGQVGYCAANAFQDAYAWYKSCLNGKERAKNSGFTVTVNWDTWKEVGFGLESLQGLVESGDITADEAENLLRHAILTPEGINIFDRIMSYSFPQVIVSTRDLIEVIEQQRRGVQSDETPGSVARLEARPQTGKLYQRPALSTEYVPPHTEFEDTCANILQQYFGFDKVGIHDNLFEFGVTSLEMIHINDRFKREVKKDIPLVIMFEFPTIHSLGQYLDREETGKSPDDESNREKAKELLHGTISILRGEN